MLLPNHPLPVRRRHLLLHRHQAHVPFVRSWPAVSFPGLCLIVGFLSVTGIPPFSCFWSKFYIFVAAFGLNSALGTVLGLARAGRIRGRFIWFILVTQRVFFGRQDPGSEGTLVIPGLFKFVLGVLILLALPVRCVRHSASGGLSEPLSAEADSLRHIGTK